MSDVRFVAAAHPALVAGLYSVRVGQRLTSGALDATFGTLAGAADLQFDAAGPRTQLAPDAFVARFPVPGTSGHQAGTLPHVVLADATLPWLRSPWAGGGGDPAASWLALILLAGPEIDVVGRRTATVGSLGRALDPGERADAPVSLLSLPADLASRILPSPSDLPFLSHVREADGAHAVVVGNRLPLTGGRYEVHLVSLEDVAPPTPKGPPVELVSLDHWPFDSVVDGPGFRDLALAVAHNCGPLRQETGVAAADDQLRRGVVALPYHGAPAWYRGPLAPALDDPARRGVNAAFRTRLPVRAEELLLFDENLEMVDATYAVAWDLGRALTLADGHAALALDGWWRARRQWAHADGQLQGLVDHRRPEPEPPPDVVAWLDSLYELHPVPTRYLVPDPERLIPRTESRWDAGGGVERGASGRLGFFAVDPVWVTVMAFGALTVGLTTSRERDQLTEMRPRGPAMRGFVLRSELVRWDDLRIQVWAGRVDPDTSDAPLATIEREIGADLRLVLVKSGASVLTVELSRAPHGLQFGIEEVGPPSRKLPRDTTGATAPHLAVDVPLRPAGDGTVAIADLARNLGALDAAVFARHMILGAPSLRLELDLADGR